ASYVAYFERPRRAELTLDPEIPGLGVGLLNLRIDSIHPDTAGKRHVRLRQTFDKIHWCRAVLGARGSKPKRRLPENEAPGVKAAGLASTNRVEKKRLIVE